MEEVDTWIEAAIDNWVVVVVRARRECTAPEEGAENYVAEVVGDYRSLVPMADPLN